MLQVNNVSKTYKNGIEALKNITFNLKRGNKVGLIGQNGCGKTTLLNVVSMLIKPTGGYVNIDSDNKNKVSFLKAESYFYENMTARENLEFFSKLFLLDRSYSNKNMLAYASKFNMLPHLDKKVKSFSSGMKQKLAMIRCFLIDSPIILLDEPTNTIDATTRDELFEILNSYNDKLIIVSSHNMHDIEMMCNKFIFLDKEIVFFGNKDKVYKMMGLIEMEMKLQTQIDLELLNQILHIENLHMCADNKLYFSVKNVNEIPYIIENMVSIGGKIIYVKERDNLLNQFYSNILGEKNE